MRAIRLRRIRRAALLGVVLGACSQGAGGDVEGIPLVARNKLRVCTHLPCKPFEFSNDAGNVAGFDVDLMQLLADDRGVKLNGVSMDWNHITRGAAFAAYQYGLAIGGATITAERTRDFLQRVSVPG